MPEEPLSAALAVARKHGLPTEQPRIIRDLTNVLVHLAPAPVIARVPLTLARLRGRDWFATEVELASTLAAAGAPVAPPAGGVDPGPHAHDGRLVTLWAFVDHDLERFDAAVAGASLRDLHDALLSYEGTLPSCDRLDEVGRLLWAPTGPLWSDLENACRGPVEYDLSCITWRSAPGTDEALRAYGEYDEALVTRLEPFVALFLAAWTVVVVERAPTDGGREELRRRIDRACAYAREM